MSQVINDQTMIHHVCALMVTQSGGFVVVSRKDNGANYGMPGGKVEEGETPLQAIKREVKEETGFDCDVRGFELIYQGPASLDGSFQNDKICATYFFKGRLDLDSAFINEEGCIVTSFTEFNYLTMPIICPFYLYNQAVIKSILKPAFEPIARFLEVDEKYMKEITERKKIRKETIQSRLDILKALKLTNLDEFKSLQRLERRNEHLFIDSW